MFSQQQSVSLKRPARPMAQYPSNPYRRPLFPHPVSISLPLSLFPLALKSLFLTSTPPLSRALHSSSSCQTLIHSPRALTKQSLPVSPAHQAPATATLLFLSTPLPLRAAPSSIPLVSLTKQSSAVSSPHQHQPQPLFSFSSLLHHPARFLSLGVCTPHLKSSGPASSSLIF